MEPADLHALATAGKPAPQHGPYRILINGVPHVVQGPTITVPEIIALAGKAPPDKYLVFERIHGHQQPNPLPPDGVVDLREPGIEQFLVLPKVQPDGFENPRRQFALPERDVKTLEALGLPWETVSQGSINRIVIYGFPLPKGYTADKIDVNVRVEGGYPDTAMDMAYFHPPLVIQDGRLVRQTSTDPFDGKVWQRWSRHRQEPDRWMPGVDDLASHLACVRLWLTAELTR